MTPRVAKRAAAAAVLVIAVAVVVVLVGSGGGYSVTAVVDQAHGVVPGAKVLAGGVQVGKVERVALGDDGLPRVRMRIDGDYRLRSGARADLRLLSNSGELNRVVALTSGRGPQLQDGAVIVRSHTDAPVELDDVLNTFDPATRKDVRHVIARLDDASHGLAPAYRVTLRHSATALAEASSLLGQVTRDGEALRTLVNSGAIATQTLARRRAALGATVQELSGLLTDTARRDDELRASVRALPAGMRSPRLALDELRRSIPTLRALTRTARPAVDELRPTARLLAPTLTTAAPVARDLAATLRQAPAGLRALEPLLRIARPTLDRLARVLPRAMPVLDIARVYTPELAGFLGNWAGMASAYDAAGHTIRAMVATRPIPNSERPPDSPEAGYIRAPFQRTPGALVGQPWRGYRDSFLAKEAGG